MTQMPPDDLPPPDGLPVDGLAPPVVPPPVPPVNPGAWGQPVLPPPVPVAPPPTPYPPPTSYPPADVAPGGYGEPAPGVGPAGYAPAGYAPVGYPAAGYGGYQTYQPGGMGVASYAGFWARLGANFIDNLLVAILPIIIYVVGIGGSFAGAECRTVSIGGGATTTQCSGGSPAVLLLGLGGAFVVGLLMSFLLVIRPIGRTGQSVGCRVTGVRIVDESTGLPIGVGRATLRHVVAVLLSNQCNLGYLWALWDDRNQTWHDKIASTVVVRA